MKSKTSYRTITVFPDLARKRNGQSFHKTMRLDCGDVALAGGDSCMHLLNRHPEAVCWLDSNLLIIYVNQAFANELLLPEEVLGIPFTKVFGVDENAISESNIEKYIEKSPVCFQSYLQRIGGEISWQEWRGIWQYKTTNDQRPVLILYGRDITELKVIEEEIQLNRQRYRYLADRFQELVCRILPDTTITYANTALCRYFNISYNRILGRSFLDLIAEEDRQAVMNLYSLSNPQNPYSVYPLRTVKHDGEITWMEWFGQGIFDSSNKLIEFQLVGRDAARCRAMEEALRESDAYYRTIFETSGTPMIIYDENMRISLANSEFEKLSGYSSVEIEQKLCWNIFVSREDLAFTTRYHNTRALHPDIVPSSYEFHFRDRQGKIKNVLITVAIIPGNNRRVASFVDITERKKMEQELRLSRETFSRAFNSSPGLMSIATVRERRYIEVNDQFCNITGFSRDEVIGKTLGEINIWSDSRDIRAFTTVLRNEGTVRNMEISFRVRSKEQRIGLLSAEMLYIQGEECIITTIADITELRQIEQEMARLDQLNLVGEIAASIGHEVRNPMTSVRGFLQMLREKDRVQAEREYFDLMIEEIDRANFIITEFLILARNKKVDLKRENLNTIIENISPLIIADAWAQDKKLEMDLGEIDDLLLDEKEIRQLVFNLVRNGMEAMTAGKKIVIRTRCDHDDVLLQVEDQGRGIDPDIIDKIGVPFFTTKEGGTGLGLSACYSIAARHHAAIKIDTGANGTCFSVRFKRITTMS